MPKGGAAIQAVEPKKEAQDGVPGAHRTAAGPFPKRRVQGTKPDWRQNTDAAEKKARIDLTIYPSLACPKPKRRTACRGHAGPLRVSSQEGECKARSLIGDRGNYENKKQIRVDLTIYPDLARPKGLEPPTFRTGI